MIHYVFDLDDTLIIHQKGVNLDYNMIKIDKLLKQLLDNCNNECYIYTNGTFGHALAVIKKMDIKQNFYKIYSRDTIPYMKPDMRSYISVENDIYGIYSENDEIYFFDDLLQNLEAAKKFGWTTFWIHPNFLTGHQYDYIDYAFKDIHTCLIFLEKNKHIL
jgi:FMN phosphatase YigB (HAD superfamily)